MGLDISPGTFCMSYGSFNNLRRDIAKSCGFDLDQMEGFAGNRSWDEIRSPVAYLLNHSDCEGKIPFNEVVQLKPELDKVCALWEDCWHKERLKTLIEACELAIKAKKPLIFH